MKVITHGRRQFLALFVPYVYWGKWVGRLALILSRSADIATDIATGLRRGVIDHLERGGVDPGKRTPIGLFPRSVFSETKNRGGVASIYIGDRNIYPPFFVFRYASGRMQ